LRWKKIHWKTSPTKKVCLSVEALKFKLFFSSRLRNISSYQLWFAERLDKTIALNVERTFAYNPRFFLPRKILTGFKWGFHLFTSIANFIITYFECTSKWFLVWNQYLDFEN
jgi:hypothetical protein